MESFPKIFALGTRYVEKIFDDEVEVTEKIDGSQIGFGQIGGRLVTRSKGRIFDTPDSLFSLGFDVITNLFDAGKIPEGYKFYGEYLSKPKHNTLSYTRTPTNYICLFGVQHPDGHFLSHEHIRYWGETLNLDTVPLLYWGRVRDYTHFSDLMDTESYLGGARIEGVVVKNYNKPYMYSGAGKVFDIMCGKYVSEAFKEVHRKNWSGEHTAKGKWEVYREQFSTPARWEKAIQHLRDDGRLLSEPKDIGPLVKEIYRDIEEECKQEAMEVLWNIHKESLMKSAIYGFPEWYKKKLIEESMSE